MSEDQRRKNKEMKRDHLKKRLESQRFESNGNLVEEQYAQHVAKKPKLLKQFPEISSDAIVPFTGPVLSPVTSQINNISGPTKFIKMSKDQGRKNKEMKHVFQSPSECEERHKILMESNVDGADSAEYSGSSQQYKSTLPGIPKGSVRQLFQNLEAPVGEYTLEDTLKARIEKIISIGQKLHSFRTLNDTQALKKITPAHSSHEVALSQVCPNNLNRAVLTPLDLIEATTSNSDAPTHGYQGSQTHSSLITIHQSSSSLVIPISCGSMMLQGSPSLILSNCLPSPSRSLSGQARDIQRYDMPRPNSLPVDDQPTMQQYSQIIYGRSIQQPNMSIPGNLSVGANRSVCMLPDANVMGMMCGINRGMPVPSPDFQGMNSPGMIKMVSTDGLLSGNELRMRSPTNVYPSSDSSSNNSMLRSHDTLQMPQRVFRSPSECEERHKILMESNVDGADSAEDSGSSQQYKRTLPGIPKGCARQLFQNLEAPVGECILEDTLIARFEKIISFGQKPPSFWTLKDTQDTQAPEKITPAHNSRAVALSQVCPNNLNKAVLTSVDLSDAITSNSDVPI